MKDAIVAEHYAAALFAVARKQAAEQQTAADLQALAAIALASPRLRQFLASPNIDRPEKKNLVRSVFGGRISETLLNLIFLLIDRSRTGYLPEIAEAYRQMMLAADGVEEMQVITAVPLPEPEAEKIRRVLETRFRKKVALQDIVDPDILAGAIIRGREFLIDGSLKTRLHRLRQELEKPVGAG